MIYQILKKILFLLPPEQAHRLTLRSLALLHKVKLTGLFSKPTSNPVQLMGLSFPNPVGLAAGFDKNGEYIDALAALGFGFIEVGTVTPLPQEGNPKPRLFRLPAHEAIINRMGFNNRGIDYLVNCLERTKYQGILGINIGKGKNTPLENAIDDYLCCMKKVLPYASYITINISSPNTANLRELQEDHYLRTLLQTLKQEQLNYHQTAKKYVPLVVKIAPDLTTEQISQIANILLTEKIDGVIATNTTIDHTKVMNSPYAKETGGLSGKPLFASSTEVVRELHKYLADKVPIIACGGIANEADALQKITAGATLLQIYTGLIYQGPGLIKRLSNKLLHFMTHRLNF